MASKDLCRFRERRGRATGVHAAYVGLAWLPAAFATLLFTDVRWFERFPSPIAGGAWGVGAVACIPFAWPVLIGLALYEGDVAWQIALGEPGAARRAAAAIAFHGACLLGVALVGFELGRAALRWTADLQGPAATGRAAAGWAWLVPTLMGAADLLLAAWVVRPEPATG
jgi:hypothetical protein